jgi:hypothetical protein
MYFLKSALALLLHAHIVHGYADPGSCSGACNVHDPGLIRRESDGKYFRFSTGNDISYASASSIEGPWTTVGSVLPDGSSIDIAGYNDLWVRIFQRSLVLNCAKLIKYNIHFIYTGTRHQPCGWCLLSILFRIDIWIARVSYWTRYFNNYGTQLMDRPWPGWN